MAAYQAAAAEVVGLGEQDRDVDHVVGQIAGLAPHGRERMLKRLLRVRIKDCQLDCGQVPPEAPVQEHAGVVVRQSAVMRRRPTPRGIDPSSLRDAVAAAPNPEETL